MFFGHNRVFGTGPAENQARVTIRAARRITSTSVRFSVLLTIDQPLSVVSDIRVSLSRPGGGIFTLFYNIPIGAYSDTVDILMTDAPTDNTFVATAEITTINTAGVTGLGNTDTISPSDIPDIASPTFVVASSSVGDSSPRGMAFSLDGSKMFVMGGTADSVREFNLPTPYSVSTISFTNVTVNVNPQDQFPRGVRFNNDGRRMYITGSDLDTVAQYNLSTPWVLNTAVFNNQIAVTAQDGTPRSLFFRNDGEKMWVVGTDNDTIFEYDLSTAWEISTATYNNVSMALNTANTNPEGVSIDPSGLRIWATDDTNDRIYQYDLTTAFDITTMVYNNVSFSTASQASQPRDVVFSLDGSKMFIMDGNLDRVNEYNV